METAITRYTIVTVHSERDGTYDDLRERPNGYLVMYADHKEIVDALLRKIECLNLNLDDIAR
jgi:hypothetical protein